VISAARKAVAALLLRLLLLGVVALQPRNAFDSEEDALILA
jgi:hypothetical protein